MSCMGAFFFPLEAGRTSLLLNWQRPFQDTARLLVTSCYSPETAISTVALLLQGGYLRSDCQQMQALYFLSGTTQTCAVCQALVMQAAGCEAASLVVRGFALSLLAEGWAAVAQLTPHQFLQTYDPGSVLAAPTLLELQLRQAVRDGVGTGPAACWFLDASAVRAVLLPPDQVAALAELGAWAEAYKRLDSTTGSAADSKAATAIALEAEELLLSLHAWAEEEWGRALQQRTAGWFGRPVSVPVHKGPRQHPHSQLQCGRCGPLDVGGEAQPQSAAASEPQHPERLGPLQPSGAAGRSDSTSDPQHDLQQGAGPGAGTALPAPDPSAALDAGVELQGLPSPAAGEGPCGSGTAAGGSANGSMQDLERLRQLLGRAQRFPLLPADQRELVGGLKGSPAALVACQADLNQYRGLIENNPLVAAWLLIAINWHTQQDPDSMRARAQPALHTELEVLSKTIPNYLAVLCTLPMTNHSMECMTTLVDMAPPPPTVLAVFVASCIRTIDSTQESSRQARLAKLLCAFLQHLFDRGQEGVVPAVFADVQSFCIAWSRLKEAAALFKRLKALEVSEGGSGSPSGLGG